MLTVEPLMPHRPELPSTAAEDQDEGKLTCGKFQSAKLGTTGYGSEMAEIRQAQA